MDVAEQLFIELGYEQTTTRAIATRVGVPVGSLYQFFPDKEAIVRSLANRYFEQEYQLFVQLHAELAEVEIATYVDRMQMLVTSMNMTSKYSQNWLISCHGVILDSIPCAAN